MRLDDVRNTKPTTPEHLWWWVWQYTGVRIATGHVCRHHQPPFDAFASWFFDRPSQALFLGPRGGGKSFLSALDTHLKSRWNPGYHTRILGGSKAQSQQIYEALKTLVWDGNGDSGSDRDTVRDLLAERARYRNGAEVKILAASSRSVRGPHIPSLKLDEVDEIDPEHREAAYGMCVADSARGHEAQVLLTSTWHKVAGPMAGLMEAAKDGAFPFHCFCIYEVLERCPTSRSGPRKPQDADGLVYENCQACPIRRSCYGDVDSSPGYEPKAKRSDGHYSIDALIQKALGISPRIFEADYLCSGPKADGLWFPNFDPEKHVTELAEYDPRLPVHLAVDSGVYTGAVFFQVQERPGPLGMVASVRVFADYLAYQTAAGDVGRALLELARQRCNDRIDVRSTDPAGGASNPVGVTVTGEYAKAGLHLDHWPVGSVADGLALVEAFLGNAAGEVQLAIHPRCVRLIQAFRNYTRASKSGELLDKPADPQHPHEDLMDALRGGLRNKFPEGRRPQPKLTRTPLNRIVG